MSSDFFADVPSEGMTPEELDAMEEEGKEKPSDSQPNKKPNDDKSNKEVKKDSKKSLDEEDDEESKETPKKEEKPLKHRTAERIRELTRRLHEKDATLKSAFDKLEEIEKKSKNSEQFVRQFQPEPWFIKKFEANTEMSYILEKWQEYLKMRPDEDLEDKKNEVVEDDAYWEKWRDDQLNELSEEEDIDFTGEQGKSLKNSFLKFIIDEEIIKMGKNSKGQEIPYYDFKKGWRLFSKLKSTQKALDDEEGEKKAKARAKLGSEKRSDGGDDESSRKMKTPKDFKGKGWQNL